MNWMWFLSYIVGPTIATVIASVAYKAISIYFSDTPDKEKFWRLILFLYIFFFVAWTMFGLFHLSNAVSSINPANLTINDVQAIAVITTLATISSAVISAFLLLFIILKIKEEKIKKNTK